MSLEPKSAIGVDINPSQSRNTTSYSIAYVKGEDVIFTEENVSLKEIISYSKKLKPDFLATDNIFELAKNEREIKRLAFLLPDKTCIVQVTGNPGSPTNTLINIAKDLNLEVTPKLSPLETAILAAKLAITGKGYKIKLREDETFVIVSKATEPSAGGMSMNRYKRNIYSNIAQAIGQIRSILNNSNLPYDFFPSKRPNEGGIFIVQAQREQVRKFIKPYEGYGIRIRLLPVIRRKIVSREETKTSKRPLIVGYDPGITIGICALDLKGNLILLESNKYSGIDEVREKLSKIGRPLIVATDKPSISAMVSKLAASFNAEICHPLREMTIDEKKKMSREYLEEKGLYDLKLDSHKRDALSAALNAFNKYNPIYKDLLEEALKRNLTESIAQDAFELVIKSKMNVKEAITKIEKDREKNEIFVVKEQRKAEKEREEIDKLKRKVEESKTLIKLLQNLIKEKEARIKELRERLEQYKDEEKKRLREERMKASLSQKIEALEIENKALRERLVDLSKSIEELTNELIDFLDGRKEIVIEEEEINFGEEKKKEIRAFKEIFRLDDKTINLILKSKIKALIYTERCDDITCKRIESSGIAVIRLKELNHKRFGKILFISKEDLKKKIEETRLKIMEEKTKEKERIIKALEDYRKFGI